MHWVGMSLIRGGTQVKELMQLRRMRDRRDRQPMHNTPINLNDL